jgi:hypothetical protein
MQRSAWYMDAALSKGRRKKDSRLLLEHCNKLFLHTIFIPCGNFSDRTVIGILKKHLRSNGMSFVLCKYSGNE